MSYLIMDSQLLYFHLKFETVFQVGGAKKLSIVKHNYKLLTLVAFILVQWLIKKTFDGNISINWSN